jgi:hypothetical protein
MDMLDMTMNRHVHAPFTCNPKPSCPFPAQLTKPTPQSTVFVDNSKGTQMLKELSCISRNLKVHYHVHKDPTLSQINPVHALQSH